MSGFDSQGAAKGGRDEKGRFVPDVPGVRKQIELDDIARRTNAARRFGDEPRSETNRQGWNRDMNRIDVRLGTEPMPKYPEHPEDRPQDIRLDPEVDGQKKAIRKMRGRKP